MWQVLEIQQQMLTVGGGMGLREYKPTGDEMSTALAAGAATNLRGGEAAPSMIQAAAEATVVEAAVPAAGLVSPRPIKPAQPQTSSQPTIPVPLKPEDTAPKAEASEAKVPKAKEAEAKAQVTKARAPKKAHAPKRAVDVTMVCEFRDGKRSQSLVLHVQDSGGQPRFLALLDLLQAPQACVGAVCFSLPELQKESRYLRINEIRMQLDAFATRGRSTPLLLIGTRKGEVTGELSELSSFLEKELKGCPALVHLVRNTEEDLAFFGVENSEGIDGDPTILRLIAAIEAAARGLPSMKLRVPPGWIAVSDELFKLTSAEHPRPNMSRAELVEIAGRCGLPHKPATMSLEREVDIMLGFLHSLGTVLWFDLPR